MAKLHALQVKGRQKMKTQMGWKHGYEINTRDGVHMHMLLFDMRTL